MIRSGLAGLGGVAATVGEGEGGVVEVFTAVVTADAVVTAGAMVAGVVAALEQPANNSNVTKRIETKDRLTSDDFRGVRV